MSYFLHSIWPAVGGSKPCQTSLKPSLVEVKPCSGDVVPSSEVPCHGQTGVRPSPNNNRPSSWEHWLSLFDHRPSLVLIPRNKSRTTTVFGMGIQFESLDPRKRRTNRVDMLHTQETLVWPLFISVKLDQQVVKPNKLWDPIPLVHHWIGPMRRWFKCNKNYCLGDDYIQVEQL